MVGIRRRDFRQQRHTELYFVQLNYVYMNVLCDSEEPTCKRWLKEIL